MGRIILKWFLRDIVVLIGFVLIKIGFNGGLL
jgi:hypothetical protein